MPLFPDQKAVDILAARWEQSKAVPDLAELVSQHPGLTPTERASLCALDQQKRAEKGHPFAAEDYLRLFPDMAADAEWKWELVAREFRLLQERQPPPNVADFLRRFPELNERFLRFFRLHGEDPGSTIPLRGRSLAPPGKQDRSAVPDQPQQIGRYQIESVLGNGGFGRVYLAWDKDLDRRVAIKVAHAHRLKSSHDVEAYLAEARILASLDHPGIVPVHDVGRLPDGRCYIVSKYVEGGNLASVMSQGRLTQGQAVKLIAAAAMAVHYAHEKGLVHRDLKPGNIMVDASGAPHLIDFGLALKEADHGKQQQTAGTPSYMSPEQARGEGHLVDGRSDIFSLGVILYELLTGQRPFRGGDSDEIFHRVRHHPVASPRQLEPSIPRELDRVCLKALAKKVRDRHASAQEFAADLREVQTLLTDTLPAAGLLRGPDPKTESSTRDVHLIPKGLRSFDAEDAEFFLSLLPGPYDRTGLPESLRFWKSRIEQFDAEKTFRVGLLYGPSGCGKSSLIKAGLLPRLEPTVLAVYQEATAEDTELRLLRGLQKVCPHLPADLDLTSALASLRRGQFLPPGSKVLIVLDQFEQWLHARGVQPDAELVGALRQCDGEHVQCLLLVRDDFWLAVSRFFGELEIDLLQSRNTALVDLFDPLHAEKVLAGFGRAFGRLPEHFRDLTAEQKQFLAQAIEGLQQDGKIISVRLALFAEMVKGKPWTPATLKEAGGAEGIGVSFLEEVFDARGASPRHRLHEPAAREVLASLLPDFGADIKGSKRSDQHLLERSGYAEHPAKFAELMRILDGEVRLLTPVENDESETARRSPGGKYYQLTHDFLVPALRQWLTRKNQATRRGRAQICLTERCELWRARPEARHLPSTWEWLNIFLLTRRARWNPPQRRMMRAATARHSQRALVFGVIVGLLAGIAWETVGRLQARLLQSHLLEASTKDLPAILDKLSSHHRRMVPGLRQVQAASRPDSREHLHTSLALLPVDATQVAFLQSRLGEEIPPEIVSVLRDALAPHAEQLKSKLWQTLADGDAPQSRRLRAACALAAFDPRNPLWRSQCEGIATWLAAENPLLLAQWIELFRPASVWLAPPLRTIFSAGETTEVRRAAALVLAEFFERDPGQLLELLKTADAAQVQIVAGKLKDAPGHVLAVLRTRAYQSPPADAGEEDFNRIMREQANAALALLLLKQEEAVWPLLGAGEDLSLRTSLIHQMRAAGVDPAPLIERLGHESEAFVRQALVLALGEYSPGEFKDREREALMSWLWDRYPRDPDTGVHSAIDWLLRSWGHGASIREWERGGQTSGPVAGRNWFINRQGQTLAVFQGPVEFWMGSPDSEAAYRDTERRHRRRISRSFAIGIKEVTIEEFRRFQPDYEPRVYHWLPADGPACSVSLAGAMLYCRWLSEQEGIPEEQMCYPPVTEFPDGKIRPHPDFFTRTGYRLVTDAEWEYACRAGTTTIRPVGRTREWILKYDWILDNSDQSPQSVGSLRPNPFGFFDILGNVSEWCQDALEAPPAGTQIVEDRPAWKDKGPFCYRDAHFVLRYMFMRSGRRSGAIATHSGGELGPYQGFRIARTLPSR